MATLPNAANEKSEKDKFVPRSTFIELCDYDPKTKALDITFKSGSTRRYMDVSPVAFSSFKESPDHNSFYARAIKGKFATVPIATHPVGHQRKQALKQPVRRKTLDAGLKQWIAGTVNRAFQWERI